MVSDEDGSAGDEAVSVSKRSRTKDEMLHEVLQDLHPLTPQKEFELEDFLWTGSGEDSWWFFHYLNQNLIVLAFAQQGRTKQ